MISLGRLASGLPIRQLSNSASRTITNTSTNGINGAFDKGIFKTYLHNLRSLTQGLLSQTKDQETWRVTSASNHTISNYACSHLQKNNFHLDGRGTINNIINFQNNYPFIRPYNTITRSFHAAGSKKHYLDFRYRFKTNHLKLHLLIIRRQKMKKHKRKKFRKKFKCLLAKQRMKREIAKEKAFRVELLTMIRKAETFDPKEYALRKIAEANNKPKQLTKEERLENLKELIRQNRHQVTYIKPKHRRADI